MSVLARSAPRARSTLASRSSEALQIGFSICGTSQPRGRNRWRSLSAFNLGHRSRPAPRAKAIPKSVRVDRQLRDLDFLLSKHALNGGAHLPFIEHDGLRIKDTPAISHMRVDPDRRCLATWIESCLPDPLSGLQTHHVGGGQIGATP